MSDISTLADLPYYVFGCYPKPVLVRRSVGDGFRDYSTREFYENIRDVSLGLRALGVRPGDRIALVCESRPEWSIADLAIITAGAVTVPIYPTLAAGQAGYILSDCGARLAIVSDRTQAAKILQVWDQRAGLEALIVIDPEGIDTRTPSAPGRQILSLADISQRGHERLVKEDGLARMYREQCASGKPEDLATIIYTSGTTGDPKGVMLTHRNLVSNLRAARQVLQMSSEDVALSFLPLSHSFERLVLYKYLYSGVTVVFAESTDTIGRDLEKVRPTVMTGVPRVYEKLYGRVLENVSHASVVRQRIFRWALNVGVKRARARLAGGPASAWLAWQDRIADRLVFRKVRARTGGRLRFVISGAAPLPVPVAEFFFAIGVPILEGYGLTETSPVLAVNPLAAPRLGTVGPAIPGVELRIAADGEVLARGPNIMRGYYNKPEETAGAIRDGWFHTGDVGTLDRDGYLTITDRKKDLIITSGGKHVAPQPLEARLKASPLVAEAMLIGDRRRFIAALIVPNLATLEARMPQPGGRADRAALLAAPQTRALYQQVIDELNGDLGQFEQIKKFALLPTEFSIGGGELTPTMKVRRRVVEERWRGVIDDLYRE